MPKYKIKRTIPGIGSISEEEQKETAIVSNRVLDRLAPDIQWLHSYIREDGTHCVYIAKNKEVIYKHSRLSGAPNDKITKVETVIDSTTAEG